MAGLSDQIGWDFECPKCGQKFEATARKLKDEPIFTCPNCGQRTSLDSGGSAAKVADDLDDLDRALDEFGKG
jgi:putative FmdB family regulatory protein